ncbi:MAG TPA: hypothetical protein VED01_05155 [Burkholderiales bacterium]|nr:hypothetical protein [Burkholderiales bacterium]
MIPAARRSVIVATAALLGAAAPAFVHATCASTIGRTSPPPTVVKVVAIDRSTVFDSPTEREITVRLIGWLQEGDRLAVVSFAGPAGATLDFEADIIAEKPIRLTERDINDIPVEKYKKLKNCYAHNYHEAQRRLERVLVQTFAKKYSDPAAFSPIFETLVQLAGAFNDARRAQSALVLISDGVHHVKGRASFYGTRGAVREIAVFHELKKLKQSGLIPDLREVSVWHIGLGQPSLTDRGTVIPRRADEMTTLRAFYIEYWKATGAVLVDIGIPLPLRSFR